MGRQVLRQHICEMEEAGAHGHQGELPFPSRSQPLAVSLASTAVHSYAWQEHQKITDFEVFPHPRSYPSGDRLQEEYCPTATLQLCLCTISLCGQARESFRSRSRCIPVFPLQRQQCSCIYSPIISATRLAGLCNHCNPQMFYCQSSSLFAKVNVSL